MAIVNTSKPGALGMANVNRAQSYETWATITTTWASETRTWAEAGSLMDSVSRPSTSITNTPKP